VNVADAMSLTKKEKALLERKEKKVKLSKAKEMFLEGSHRFHKAKNREGFEEAAEFYTIAISLRPAMAKYYHARANCFIKMTEFRRACTDYSAAIRIAEATQDPGMAGYYSNRGFAWKKMAAEGAMKAQSEQSDLTEKAIADYSHALRLEPTNNTHYYNRALVFYDSGRLMEAIRDFTHATTDSKYAYRAYSMRGNCYRKMGQLEDSIDDLRTAVEREPSNPQGHNNLGLSHFEMGNFKEASTCFSDAINLDKTNPLPYNNRGLCYYHMDEEYLTKGLEDFERAIALDPSEADYCFNRGNVLLGLSLIPDSKPTPKKDRKDDKKMGKESPFSNLTQNQLWMKNPKKLHEEALKNLKQAAALDPKSPRYIHSIGLAYQQMNNIQKALEQFERALRLDPKHMPSRYHAGLMLYRLGEHHIAIEWFSEVLEVVQSDHLVYESRGLVFQTIGDHQRAVEDFSAALLLAPKEHKGEDHYYRGESLLALGRYKQALQDLDMALQLDWHDAAVYHARGITKQYLGQPKDAIEDFREALTKEPENPKFLYDRGQCYRSIGMAEQAEDDLTKALEETPGELRLLYGAGLAAYELNKNETAIDHLSGALQAWERQRGDGLAPGVLCDIHYHLGLAHANRNQHEPAIECFSKAAEEAKDEEIRMNCIHERAKSRQMEQEYGLAITDFNAVIEHNPRNAHAFFRRGFAWKSLGDFDKAADDFETAKMLAPDNPHLVLNYSRIHDTEVVVLCAAGEETHF